MQKRLARRVVIEISRLLPQRKVRHEGRPGRDVLGERAIILDQLQIPSRGQRECQHKDERRKNPADSPHVKFEETEISAIETLEDNARNQEAGDHEEDIDTNEAAAERSGAGVKSNNRKDSKRAQSVDVGTVIDRMTHGRHRQIVMPEMKSGHPALQPRTGMARSIQQLEVRIER